MYHDFRINHSVVHGALDPVGSAGLLQLKADVHYPSSLSIDGEWLCKPEGLRWRWAIAENCSQKMHKQVKFYLYNSPEADQGFAISSASTILEELDSDYCALLAETLPEV